MTDAPVRSSDTLAAAFEIRRRQFLSEEGEPVAALPSMAVDTGLPL